MAKVYLYEDTGGSLYLHRQGDDTAYANIDLMVEYGATFEQDASNLADGRPMAGEVVTRVPYAELEQRLLEPDTRRIAVWDDGRIHRFAHPGRDGERYLQSQREQNPAFDNMDRAGL